MRPADPLALLSAQAAIYDLLCCRPLLGGSLPPAAAERHSTLVVAFRPPPHPPTTIPPTPSPLPPTLPRSVAYLKGLLTAGEVASAARQAPDRQLTRILCDALQHRVDAAAGDTALPVTTALQLVANIASLLHSLGTLDEFALGQARGDTAETVAAAAAAAAAAVSRSPSPGRHRGRSRSQSPTKHGGGAGQGLEPRGRQQDGDEAAAAAAGSSKKERSPSRSRASSAASAPSPPRSPSPAAAQLPAPSSQQQASQASQQHAHTVLSFTASGPAAASSGTAPAAPGGSGAALQALLESAEALVVRSISAQAAGWLAEGERLDWAPAEQARSTGGYSGHIEELVMYLKVGTAVYRCVVGVARCV